MGMDTHKMLIKDLPTDVVSMVDDNVSGVLSSDQKYTKAMQENNENLRNDLAAAGLKRSMNFSWEKTAVQLYELCKEVSTESDFDFDTYYDKSALRTLTSICLSDPELKRNFLPSVIKFDFTKLIEWALSKGLEDPITKDYFIPLKSWMENYSDNFLTIKKDIVN